MMRRIQKQRGQVVVMVTLVLIVMCGVLGLAVDLGWSYYIRKSAQAAVDSAAISAAQAAYSILGQTVTASCANVTCQAVPEPCPASITTPANNLETGCLYARQNGFSYQGNNGRQNVTMAANITSPPDTAPGVRAEYWVTARGAEVIPQLFSAVLGNTVGTSSARATAAVVKQVVPGSLYSLNWENDPGYTQKGSGGVKFRDGVGMFLQGNSSIDAGAGVYIASSADGSNKNNWAAMSDGQVTVMGSSVNIRSTGKADHPGVFTPTPTNLSMMDPFLDPMRGKGQPPAATGLTPMQVPGGTINGDCSANGGKGTLLSPGAYYATNASNGQATGAPIQIAGGCVEFSGGSFGNYEFYGGLQFPSTNTTATFGPGRYFMVGATSGNPLFYARNGNRLLDNTPLTADGSAQPPLDAGEIFVFTAPGYPGLTPPSALSPILGNLQFGGVEIHTGNNDGSQITLHGLNGNYDFSSLDPRLSVFTPTLFWMDQRNSKILYNPDGTIDTTSCGAGHTLANPCLNTNPSPAIDPFMQLIASPNTDLFGVVYMPRGSYLDFQGSPGMTSPLQVIAGAVNMGGGGNLNLNAPTMPLTRRVVSLVE